MEDPNIGSPHSIHGAERLLRRKEMKMMTKNRYLKMMTQTRYLWVTVALAAVLAAAIVLGFSGQQASAQSSGVDTIDPPTYDLGAVQPGDSQNVTKDVHLEALPAKADIVLAIDTTGSMSGAIAQAQSEATQLVNNLQTQIPGARFAVVDFKDYPFVPYGDDSDYPYTLLTSGLTSNSTAVQSAIDGLSASGGGDFPESYNRVFYEAYSDPALNYDPEAEKFLVVLGDAPPHDPNLSTVAPACGDQPPIDPGRDGIPNSSDDLLTQGTLQGLNDNNTTLLMIRYDSYLSLECYQQLAEKTGGSAVSSGTGLSQTIIDLVEAKAKEIQEIELQFSDGCGLNVSTDPASPLPGGPFTAPYDFSFTETISVPGDATSGTKNCELKVIADGAERVKQTITANVANVEIQPEQPETVADCKKNGWKNFPALGFKNQGDCVSYVRTNTNPGHLNEPGQNVPTSKQ